MTTKSFVVSRIELSITPVLYSNINGRGGVVRYFSSCCIRVNCSEDTNSVSFLVSTIKFV